MVNVSFAAVELNDLVLVLESFETDGAFSVLIKQDVSPTLFLPLQKHFFLKFFPLDLFVTFEFLLTHSS